MKDFWIKVSEKNSADVQLKLFGMGYRWSSGIKEVQYHDAQYLHALSGYRITKSYHPPLANVMAAEEFLQENKMDTVEFRGHKYEVVEWTCNPTGVSLVCSGVGNTSPLPTNIAKKYKFAAMDEDGEWYVSQDEPESGKQTWNANDTIRLDAIFDDLPTNIPWKESLHKRNDEGTWSKVEACPYAVGEIIEVSHGVEWRLRRFVKMGDDGCIVVLDGNIECRYAEHRKCVK